MRGMTHAALNHRESTRHPIAVVAAFQQPPRLVTTIRFIAHDTHFLTLKYFAVSC